MVKYNNMESIDLLESSLSSPVPVHVTLALSLVISIFRHFWVANDQIRQRGSSFIVEKAAESFIL